MFLRHFAGSLLILAVGVLPGLGQGRQNSKITYSISGSVRDDSGQHDMQNIRVDLKEPTGEIVKTAFTGGNGEFEFDNLSSGDYSIEVNEKDYEPARQAVTIFNSPIRGVSIFLSKPVAPLAGRSDITISAHQLSAPRRAHDEFDKGINLLYAKSDYQGAIIQFQRAIKDFPTYYEAYAEVGEAYIHLGQMGPAEQALRKSIDLSSGQYSDGLFMLSELLSNANRYSEAEAIARRETQSDASSWQGAFELARALFGLKEAEEAEKSAIRARDLQPDYAPVHLLLANIHIERRDYPALLRDLDAYLNLVPNGSEADQARKTRDELQAALQRAENRTHSRSQENSQPDGQVASSANTTPAESSEEDSTPAPEPDLSGLPSLPPPSAGN